MRLRFFPIHTVFIVRKLAFGLLFMVLHSHLVANLRNTAHRGPDWMHVVSSCACVWLFVQLQSASFFLCICFDFICLACIALKINYYHSWPICSLLDHILSTITEILPSSVWHFIRIMKDFKSLLLFALTYIFCNMLKMAFISKHLFSFWLNSNTCFLIIATSLSYCNTLF